MWCRQQHTNTQGHVKHVVVQTAAHQHTEATQAIKVDIKPPCHCIAPCASTKTDHKAVKMDPK